jgi:xylan 1,4-beta-xylosidase
MKIPSFGSVCLGLLCALCGTSASTNSESSAPVTGQSSTYSNPIVPGFFPDPSIVRVGEDYYLVNSTFQYFPAIIISHSRDLVHWEQIGHVFTDSKVLDLSGFRDGCGVWAPDISYHEGEFYIFYCLVELSPDRKVNVRGNYMVKSKSIHGPWSKPVRLTDEGNDPSHFVDDDGTHYMLYAAGMPKGTGTKIVKLNKECTKVVEGPYWMSWGMERGHPEGPHLFKKDGYYYHHMAAGGGWYEGHHQVIARSRNLYGPYEPSPHNPFIAQLDRNAAVQHQGHAKLVQTPKGDWWAVYLCQRRTGGRSQLGRETGLDKVDWHPDGWPVLNGGRGPSVTNTVPDLPQSPVPIPPPKDDFQTQKLALRWEFLRNPDHSRFSLTERPGFLRIRTGKSDLDSPTVRNVILQREVSKNYTAETRLEFAPKDGEEAGLVCMYDGSSFIKFALTGKEGQLKLLLEECRKKVCKSLAEVSGIKPGPVFLRVTVRDLKRSFSYSHDGKSWIEAGIVPDAGFLSDEGTAFWGFTGTMVGVYAIDKGSGNSIPADFDWFSIASDNP